MIYRAITDAEIPIVADIQSRAFRTQADGYVTHYREGGRYDWRAVRLLEDDEGQAVAALTIFERLMSLNGGQLAAGLIASVGVPPEQRRRGYARRLMIGLLEELHRQRLPVSLLYPFSTAFYRSLGYGLANMNWFLDIPPRELPDFPERLAVRRATPGDEPAIRACYERARRQPHHNGWFKRTDWEWHHRVWKPERETVVYVGEGTIAGYLIYTLTADWERGVNPVKVIEWVTTSDAAWRGLLGFLAALGEQATVISYNAPQGTPLLAALREPYSDVGGRAEFVYTQAARLVVGFMLRVTHLPTALRGRHFPPAVAANFVLQVDDPQLAGNSEAAHVHITNGAASVAPASGPFGRGQSATVETDIATFSQLFTGITTAEQARSLGRLNADDETCALLTAAFAAAPLYLHQSDWF
ncbi:MAG: GNAT family N-acetyltransferase [Ardenticatenaceae bacterium]|nr:GNAT family N-acetyltransferase [Ardenticatenaceae bacterium]